MFGNIKNIQIIETILLISLFAFLRLFSQQQYVTGCLDYLQTMGQRCSCLCFIIL